MKYHLAILTPGWIDLILDGKKTIESRFTKVRCAPFRKVHEGDVVYLKESGGLVKGMFRVAEVETFENLNRSGIQAIYERCGQAIFYQAFTQFFPPEKWLTAKHATLIHADPVRFDNDFRSPSVTRGHGLYGYTAPFRSPRKTWKPTHAPSERPSWHGSCAGSTPNSMSAK